MKKTLRSNQRFAASTAAPAPHQQRNPQFEEIKRTLFPGLLGEEAPQRSKPRFADLVEQFVTRRSA